MVANSIMIYKNHLILYMHWVNFIVYKLYLNEVVYKRSHSILICKTWIYRTLYM